MLEDDFLFYCAHRHCMCAICQHIYIAALPVTPLKSTFNTVMCLFVLHHAKEVGIQMS